MTESLMFVTSNADKVLWLEKFLGWQVEHRAMDIDEIQSLDSREVLEYKTHEAYKKLKVPVLVEDTSLVFNAMGKLPGTFIKFFLHELGNEGLCRLLDGYEDRSALARVIYGYYDGRQFQHFDASLEGSISQTPKGDFGHGWDNIFIPAGQPKTFGEMTEEDYQLYSLRDKAVQKLKAFLIDKDREL